MKLSDLLVDAWIALPLEAGDLGGVLRELFLRVAAGGLVEERRAQKLARDLAFGRQGEVSRVNDDIVIVLASLEALSGPAVTLAVTSEPFVVNAEGRTQPGWARAVVLILVPGRLTAGRQELVPVITRALRDPGRTRHLLEAGSVEAIRGLKELMETEVEPRSLVADALVPVRYRVYPDTPVREVVDLMVRRGVHAVPVVGERYEVLGILTSGDALSHLLSLGRQKEGEREGGGAFNALARDFMTRTVLCVSEEQSLAEAANMMVNRDVEQLPVVREGELVGFVTRDSILRALHGALDPEHRTDQEHESESTT